MDREVSRPVLGFSEGMFSICILSFPNSPSTSTSWQLRLRPGVAIIWTRVESGPMPARLTAADTLMFAGNPLQASLADPSNNNFSVVILAKEIEFSIN